MSSIDVDKLPVFVIDDDIDMRESIEWILTSFGYQVTVFEQAKECLESMKFDDPCCIIVDLLMPGLTGLQFCRELFKKQQTCAVIMISAHGDVSTVVESMKMGVIDFLEKPFTRETLLNAVNRAKEKAQELYHEQLEEKRIIDRIKTLSARELQILECVSQGMVTKQIAKQLGISTRTVDVHRSNILQKLKISSIAQLSSFLYLYQRHHLRNQISNVLPNSESQ
ncbi:response regulator transcription factor [Pirellulaceae bacterium SH449]